MKKIINAPETFIPEMLEGIYAAHPDELMCVEGDLHCLVSKRKHAGKVGIATGGGSGHLPLFLGYVGEGMLDGCSIGDVFQSPSAEQMLAVTKAIDQGAGVLYIYGNYNGALNIYNLPTSLMAAVTAAVIPAVSGALARRDRRGAGRITGSALRISALAACPMAVGLFVLGEPIMALIFPNLNPQLAGPLLSTLGLATLFVCMMLVCNSILQAHGFVSLPVIIMVAGGVVKIITNYNVVIQPTIGIYGAPMGNILCFALCMTLDLVVMSRVIPRRPKYIQVFAKPLAASALMGLGAWAVHGLMSKLFEATGIFMSADPVTHEVLGLSRTGNAAATLLAILVAVVIYGVLVIALRAITKDDLMLMPKGEKIARMLHL